MGFLKSTKGKIILITAVILIIASVVFLFLFMDKEESYRTISVSEIYGKVTAENGGSRYDAYKNMTLSDGYGLITDKDSYTRMLLDDDKFIKLEEESYAKFESLGKNGSGNTVIRLERGKITNEITAPLSADEDYVIHTPNAVLAVRGTFFIVQVTTDRNGEYITNVLTYGGKVLCKRVMPDGSVVDEEVYIEAGYKTTIGMNDSDTFYIIEQSDDEHKNTEPINISDLSDDDLVEIYNAVLNNHEMFMAEEELWAEIEKRGIDLSLYRSKYDGSEIPVPVKNEQTETTTVTSPVTTTTTTTTTVITTASSEITEETTTPTEEQTSSVATTTVPVESTTTQSVTSETSVIATTVPEELITTSETSEETVTSEADLTEDTTVTTADTEISTDETTVETTTTEIITTTPPVTSPHIIFTTPTTSVHECSFENYVLLSEATCTSNEVYIATCICGEIDTVEMEGTMLPHTYENYVTEIAATCTENEIQIGTCVCGATETREIPDSALGHTIVTEDVPATLASDGYHRVYCSVCDTDIEEKIIYPKLSSLDITDGQITITSTGYTQGSESDEVAYTGEYTIKGNSLSDGDFITVASGTPMIILDGDNGSSVLNVNSGADVTLKGNSGSLLKFENEGKITFADGDITFTDQPTNSGEIIVESGNITFASAITNNGGIINVTGGTLNFSGETYALHNDGGNINFSGGDVTIDGVTNNSSGTISISAGTVTSLSDFNVNGGELNITGGECTFNGATNGLYIWGGVINISGGNISCSGANYGIYNNETIGRFYMSGGTVNGGKIAISNANTVVTGGSLYIINADSMYYDIVDADGNILTCTVFDTYDDFVSAGITGYNLSETDAATDGKYYVWKPVDTP